MIATLSSGELTYGLERLAMYSLGVDHVMECPSTTRSAAIALTYGDVFQQTEEEYARWNFDAAIHEMLLRHFEDAEAECANILDNRIGSKAASDYHGASRL